METNGSISQANQSFTNRRIEIAVESDIPEINRLINRAYRGKAAANTWTSEAHLISGDRRTDTEDLKNIFRLRGSVFLKYLGEERKITGCVNLQHRGQKLYLGMLSVLPEHQGEGIGRILLQASEEYARQLQSASLYMTVIAQRRELIHWYERRGYRPTGEISAFIEDELTGKHLRPLEFMTLEKILG